MPMMTQGTHSHHVGLILQCDAVSSGAIVSVKIMMSFPADMPKTEQVSYLMVVSPKLYRGVRNHRLALDVQLTIKHAVRAKLFAIMDAYHGDGIVCLRVAVSLAQFELTVNVATASGIHVRPIQPVVMTGSLQPENSIPEALRGRKKIARVVLKLPRGPALNLPFRGVGWHVIGVAVKPSPARGWVNLYEVHSDENRQVRIGVGVAHEFVQHRVPLTAILQLWAGTDERAEFEIYFRHEDPRPRVVFP